MKEIGRFYELGGTQERKFIEALKLRGYSIEDKTIGVSRGIFSLDSRNRMPLGKIDYMMGKDVLVRGERLIIHAWEPDLIQFLSELEF